MLIRKKPIVLEAEFTKEVTVIHTLEGDMTAQVGDVIVTGVNGERYPIKREIFDKTYDIVGDSNVV